MKKISAITLALMMLFSSASHAADFSAVWGEDGTLRITVSGKGENGIIISDGEDNILYMDQGRDESTFLTNIQNQTDIKISVTGDGGIVGKLNKSVKNIYVSPDGSDENDGTKQNPYKTMEVALGAAKDGDVIVCDAISSSEIVSDKKVTVSGKLICETTHLLIDGVTLENIDISAKTLQLKNGACLGDGVEVSENATVECSDAGAVFVKSGKYKDISANGAELHIYNDVGVYGEITVSPEGILVFEEGADLSNYVKNSGRVFYLSSGGTVKRTGERITVNPEDGRLFSIDGGTFLSQTDQSFQSGEYGIDFEYNFKISRLELDLNEGTVSVGGITKNLNNEDSAKEPRLITAIYDSQNCLKQIVVDELKQKTFSVENETELCSDDLVRIYMWDSFDRMVPLASIVQKYASEGIKKEQTEAVQIYVSPEGDDSATGSMDKPLRTLSAAQALARKKQGTVIVNLRGGRYETENTLNFTASDDNTIYRAYNGEKVILSDVQAFSGAEFTKPDQEFLSKIINAEARDKIAALKLSGMDSLEFKSFSTAKEFLNPTVFADGKKMNYARFPDSDFSTITGVSEDGGGKQGFSVTIDEISKRSEQWDTDSFILCGYFGADWADGAYSGSLGGDGKFVSDTPYYTYAPNTGARVFAQNVPEELNAPGEYYLDFENKVLYIYPYEDFSDTSEVYINYPKGREAMFNFDGVRNLSIEGITFDAVCAEKVLKITDSKSIDITGCEFSNLLGTAVYMEGCEKSVISDSYVHDTAGRGIVVSGGNTADFTPGGNVIKNNRFERFATDRKTYQPAIQIYGVGNSVLYNKISDSAHMGIGYLGNFNTIEHNELYNLCRETNDCGAIYAGRTFFSGGNSVKYNYIHDIYGANDSFETVVGVYFDDRFSGQEVASNVFKNVGIGVLIGSGRCNDIEKNVFIDCAKSVVILRYGSSAEREELYNSYDREIWYEKFPWLENLWDDNPEAPLYNKVNYNLYFNSPEMEFNEWQETLEECQIENSGNCVSEDTTIFKDWENGDYSIAGNSGIFKLIPQFERIEP